jgi:hypothetical protein
MQNDLGQLICCPGCMASDVRPSHRRKMWDWAMELMLAAPLRCRSCGRRFYRRVTSIERRSRSLHD